METARVKSYAKLNLTLSVTGVKDGFHMLDSIVTSVDVYDLIKVKKRRDKLVSVTMRGMGSESIPFERNNAVKAAEIFIKKYDTCGADITVFKNIPIGAGMGGSSADSAGVINALAKLYKIYDFAGLKLIADMTGSDSRYMLSGGYARLFGRGDIVKSIESRLKLDFLLLVPPDGVGTPECFKKYDSLNGGRFSENSSDRAEELLVSGDKRGFCEFISNDLTSAGKELSPDIEKAVEELKAFDPLAVSMTGSGSGVFAVFENPEFCAYAKSRYIGKFRAYTLKTKLL